MLFSWKKLHFPGEKNKKSGIFLGQWHFSSSRPAREQQEEQERSNPYGNDRDQTTLVLFLVVVHRVVPVGIFVVVCHTVARIWGIGQCPYLQEVLNRLADDGAE